VRNDRNPPEIKTYHIIVLPKIQLGSWGHLVDLLWFSLN